MGHGPILFGKSESYFVLKTRGFVLFVGCSRKSSDGLEHRRCQAVPNGDALKSLEGIAARGCICHFSVLALHNIGHLFMFTNFFVQVVFHYNKRINL